MWCGAIRRGFTVDWDWQRGLAVWALAGRRFWKMSRNREPR